MSNEHVDYMLYDLARSALLMRIAEVCADLRKAREAEDAIKVAELQASRLVLWEELYDLPALEPKTCAFIVRKYSADMVRAQSVLRDLAKLRTP